MSSFGDGANPPFPEVKEDFTSDSGSSEKKSGQKLLALVRQMEKTSDLEGTDYEEKVEDTVKHFNFLILLYSRRGLLQGDLTKAERILSTLKTKTRERGSKGKSNGKGKTTQSNNADSTNSVGFQQEFLVLTAVVRALNNPNLELADKLLDDDHALMIALAAELCIAICQYIHRAKGIDQCAQAEYELLMESGKALLSGIVFSLRGIERDIQLYTEYTSGDSRTMKCLVMAILDHDKHIDPIVSCMKAASSLVNLFGTKLSRSTTLLSDLNSVAWKFLTANETSIQSSAARLVASIPMAGGTDRMRPSDIWNRCLCDVVSMMSSIIHTMAPLNKSSKRGEKFSEDKKIELETWVTFARGDVSEEPDRVLSFHIFLRGLTFCFQSLVSRDGLSGHETTLIDAKVDVENILDVVETLVSFPLAAETTFYKTKKRLRNETVDGGMLSARAVALLLGNHTKQLGHGILDSLLQCFGGSTLLPYSTRIIRVSYASLLTSCSGPLRKVLDPTSSLRLDGKKRKWLHRSIPVRRSALETVKTVLTQFGNGKREKASPLVTSKNDMEKAIALAAGCFVEEISKSPHFDEPDVSWGTFRERCSLVVSSLECLQAALVSCGGFLAMPIRSMVDSVVLTGLQSMNEQNELLSVSNVKTSILELASCCVTTPWSDGASSSLSDLAVLVAKKCQSDMDAKVCVAAKVVLRVCATIAVPRCPALLYVSRAVAAEANAMASVDQTGRDLIKNIQVARNELMQSEKVNELVKRKNAEEKRHREVEEKQAKEPKRKKIEAQEMPLQDWVPSPMKAPTNADESSMEGLGKAAMLIDEGAEEEVQGDSSIAKGTNPSAKDLSRGEAPVTFAPNDSVNRAAAELTKPQVELDQLATESDGDFDFPDIVDAEGPDSDDE